MKKITKHIITAIKAGIAIGLIYYLVQSNSIEWSSLTGMTKIWELTLLAIILFTIVTILQSWRLHILINTHQLSLTFFSSVKLTFIGLFFNTYLPGATGGDLVKIYYASKGNPGSRTEVITIILLDRFVGLFTLLSLPLIFSPFFMPLIESQPTLKGLLWVSMLIAIGIIIVVILGAKYDLENSKLIKWIEHKILFGKELKRILHTIHYYSNSKLIVLKVLFISFLAQSLMVGVSLLIAGAILPQGADPKMLVLIPLGYFANALPVTPGGIGVGEAVMESLFNLISLDGGAEVILGWRIVTVIVGIIGLIFYLKSDKKFISKSDKDTED